MRLLSVSVAFGSMSALPDQAAEGRLDVAGRAAEAVVEIEMPESGVEIVAPEQARPPAGRARRIPDWRRDRPAASRPRRIRRASFARLCRRRPGLACRRPWVGALGKYRIDNDKKHRGAEGGGNDTHTKRAHGGSGLVRPCRPICFLHMPTGFGQHCGEAAAIGGEPAMADPEARSSALWPLFGLKQPRSPTPICSAQKLPFGRRDGDAPERDRRATAWQCRAGAISEAVSMTGGACRCGLRLRLFALAALAIVAVWAWLGAAVEMPQSPLAAGEKLHCVSYAPFRARSGPVRAGHPDRSPADRGGPGPAQARDRLRAHLFDRSRPRPDPGNRQAPRHEGDARAVAVEPARTSPASRSTRRSRSPSDIPTSSRRSSSATRCCCAAKCRRPTSPGPSARSRRRCRCR